MLMSVVCAVSKLRRIWLRIASDFQEALGTGFITTVIPYWTDFPQTQVRHARQPGVAPHWTARVPGVPWR